MCYFLWEKIRKYLSVGICLEYFWNILEEIGYFSERNWVNESEGWRWDFGYLFNYVFCVFINYLKLFRKILFFYVYN